MLKGRFWQMAFVWTVLAVVVSQTALATCTGSTPCHACKNCQHCTPVVIRAGRIDSKAGRQARTHDGYRWSTRIQTANHAIGDRAALAL
jgi:hypothetical protein